MPRKCRQLSKVHTLTSKWRSWSSRVGAMRRGRIWLNSGPAPSSRALSVSWRNALFRCGGVPFFTFSRHQVLTIYLEDVILHLFSKDHPNRVREGGHTTSTSFLKVCLSEVTVLIASASASQNIGVAFHTKIVERIVLPSSAYTIHIRIINCFIEFSSTIL